MCVLRIKESEGRLQKGDGDSKGEISSASIRENHQPGVEHDLDEGVIRTLVQSRKRLTYWEQDVTTRNEPIEKKKKSLI